MGAAAQHTHKISRPRYIARCGGGLGGREMAQSTAYKAKRPSLRYVAVICLWYSGLHAVLHHKDCIILVVLRNLAPKAVSSSVVIT